MFLRLSVISFVVPAVRLTVPVLVISLPLWIKESDSGLPSYIIRQVAVKPPTLVVAVTYALPPSKPLRAVMVAVSEPSLSGVSVRYSLMSLPSMGVHHLIDQSTDLSGASTGITVAVMVLDTVC